jgi:hypothetical protein
MTMLALICKLIPFYKISASDLSPEDQAAQLDEHRSIAAGARDFEDLSPDEQQKQIDFIDSLYQQVLDANYICVDILSDRFLLCFDLLSMSSLNNKKHLLQPYPLNTLLICPYWYHWSSVLTYLQKR